MSDAPKSKSSASDSTASNTKGGFYLSSRKKIWILAVCLTLMIGASVYAVLQPLKADPFDASLSARLLYPRETNPYAHLQAVRCANDYACRLNSVAVNGTGDLPEVWAVGNVGLVLHRPAGQTKWEQITITAKEQESSTPAPTPTPGPRPSPTATPVGRSAANPRQTPAATATPSPVAVPTPTPVATSTPTPAATPTSGIPVPNLIGLTLEEAQKMAAAGGFQLQVKYEGGEANVPSKAAQQGPPPDLRIIKQSPEPKTMALPKSTINVTLGRAPKSAARLLMERLVPSVYAAEPERRPKQPQTSSQSSAQQNQAPQSTPSASAGTTPQPSRIFPLDDDLIYIFCIEPVPGIVKMNEGCHVFGRSGRIYYINSNNEWSFTQALLLGVGSPTPIDSPSILYASDWYGGYWPSLLARSNDTIFICIDRMTASHFQCSNDFFSGKTTSDGLFLINIDQIPGGPAIFGKHAINNTVERLLVGDSGFIARVLFRSTLDQTPISEVPPGMIKRIPSRTTAALFSSAFASNTHGFIVGDQGIILSTTDGGNTWRHETQGPEGATPNHRLPALWYWIFAFLMMLTCSVVVAAPLPPQRTEFSVADWAVSDAPLRPGDLDSLDFTPMALGLSRFIRNPKTQPPVTIAIEGQWGEGKSSVMALLRGDLEKSRFRPVWFNAWHHQSEEQLLAALLEHIKSQAIPPWWHLDNWIFRARLLHVRFRQKWPLLIILALTFMATASFELSRYGLSELAASPQTLIPFKKYIPGLQEAQKPAETKAADSKSPDSGQSKHPGDNSSESNQDLRHLGLLASALGLLSALFKKIKTFGIDSTKLTDNLRDAATIKDVKPDPGIRRQFSREFGDLCKAWSWGGRRVIIFIDDLDRCRPESVVTVLESINFLTTAGDCMIVLGMAQEQVTHCVGLSFKDIAEAESAYEGGGNTEREKAVARFSYGALYIKKLVNIVARLPKTTEEQRRRVLEARAAAARRHDEEQQTSGAAAWRTGLWEWLSQAGGLTFKVAPVFGLALAVILSVIVGYRQGVPKKPAPAGDHLPVETQAVKPTEPPQPQASNIKSGAAKPLVYDRPTTQPATLADPDKSAGGVWWSYGVDALFLFILFGVLAYELSTRTNLDAQNSPEFEESLNLWGPYIVGVCDTPREIKRALNDLRYLAMTRRTIGPSSTRGERMLRALRQFVTGRAEERSIATRVDEAALPPWKAAVLANLTDEEWKYFLDPNPNKVYANISENLKRLMELKSRHFEVFGRWIVESKARGAAGS